MFFVLSVWCDYRRCRLPVVLYVQAVCVLFVLSVWRDYRRCCLTVVLRLLSRAAKVFFVRGFSSGLVAALMSLAAAAEARASGALVGRRDGTR